MGLGWGAFFSPFSSLPLFVRAYAVASLGRSSLPLVQTHCFAPHCEIIITLAYSYRQSIYLLLSFYEPELHTRSALRL